MYRTQNLYLVIAFFAVMAGGCAESLNQWEGSVDAVFRYRPSENSTLVHEIRPESFSEAAGLKAGDLLLAVDGKDITGAVYEEVRAALRGPVGTVTVLTVKRGETIVEVSVERRPMSQK